MNNQRNLVFPEPHAYYDFGRMAVMFMGRDANKIIQSAINVEALEDFFEGTGIIHYKSFKLIASVFRFRIDWVKQKVIK